MRNGYAISLGIVATEGGEIVQFLGVAMMATVPYTPLKGAAYIHQTLAEGLWSLMEAEKPVD